MLCKLYRLFCTAVTVVLKWTAWSLIIRSLPHFFFNSKNRISSLYRIVTKKKDVCWYRCRPACRECVGGIGRHACSLSAGHGWVLKGRRSLRPHTQCSLIFMRTLSCAHMGKQVCKEGGEGGIKMNLGDKPGEDRLRPNSQCSCSHTCLPMGFSTLAPLNPCFQWVSSLPSRKSKQLGYGKGWNLTVGTTDKIRLLFSVKLYTGVKLQNKHHGCCICVFLRWKQDFAMKCLHFRYVEKIHSGKCRYI